MLTSAPWYALGSGGAIVVMVFSGPHRRGLPAGAGKED